jgi:transposase
MGIDQGKLVFRSLSAVERAFRILKSLDLLIRPIYHRLPDRVRGHVLLCLLAYYVEWHLRGRLAPLLFDDDDKMAALTLRKSVVAPAQRSLRARRKARTKQTPDGLPVHSFRTLMSGPGDADQEPGALSGRWRTDS